MTILLKGSFDLHIRMDSDWHIGTGTGIPGSIDALIARDQDDFPFVPAKTVIGMWRDGVERLAYGLDGGDLGGVWSQWVAVIFGSQPAVDSEKQLDVRPRPARLTVRPGRLSKALRERMVAMKKEDRLRYRQAMTFRKPEIRIDELSGTSADDMLRNVEMGRIGTNLEAPCELDLEGLGEKGPLAVSALLIGGAKLVDRIGGKRRRGAGKCSFSIADTNIDEVVAAFRDDTKLKTAPAIPDFQDGNQDAQFVPSSSADEWTRVPYLLRLKTPVAIVTATLGNVSESLDFIPGTYLLPYITGKNSGLFGSVANGDFQVSPATPEVYGKRSLPVPLVFEQDKLEVAGKKPIRNRMEEEVPKEIQTNPLRAGFVSVLDSGNNLVYAEPREKHLLMHNCVNDKTQRPDETSGGPYSRQAIAAGSVLRGEIRYRKAVQNVELKDGKVRLGTSKKDDYGWASIEFLRDDESGMPEAQICSEPPPAHNSKAAGDFLVVYLESDSLLRDEYLRPSNQAADLLRELENTFGTGSLAFPEDDPKSRFITQTTLTRRIESWQNSWGRPRPTLVAMAAGSCVTLQVAKPITAKNLNDVQNAGLGERRGEGYGRVRFDPPRLGQSLDGQEHTIIKSSEPLELEESPDGKQKESAEVNAPIEDKDDLKFGGQLELAVWRQELHHAVLAVAMDRDARKEILGFEKNDPPMSQIGALRSVVMRLSNDAASKNAVREWYAHLAKTKNRRDKWPHKFGKFPGLFGGEQPEDIWNLLELNAPPPPILLKDGERGDPSPPKDRLWAEAVRALFDSCTRAHKSELDTDRQGRAAHG